MRDRQPKQGTPQPATLDSAQIETLVRGEHGDPFAVLGPHVLPEEGGSKVVIRAFRPGVLTMTVMPLGLGLRDQPMARIHPDGFYEAVFPNRREPFPYRLRWMDGERHEVEAEDVYRFGSRLSDYDLYLMGEGRHYREYEKLGAHLTEMDGVSGVSFGVWAPNACRVSVVGDFNGWDGRVHPMRLHPGNGIWELFLPGLGERTLYKFEILPCGGGPPVLKADPYAFAFELPPGPLPW